MTCKLSSGEKASRIYLRYIKTIINQMLTKRTYPHDIRFKNGLTESTTEPFGEKKIMDTGVRTIEFSYHARTLRKARRK